MIRIIVCSSLLVIVMEIIRRAALGSFDVFGFWGGMTICWTFTIVLISSGFLYDYLHNRRLRERPQEPRDSQ